MTDRKRASNGRFVSHLRLVDPTAPPRVPMRPPRGRIAEDFLAALAADFAAHGKAVVSLLRREEPAHYLRLVAGLVPKEAEAKRALEELSDDDLQRLADLLAAAARDGAALHPSDPPRAGSPEVD
jgi:hypothetical protein